jgi:uncharacterized OB-fold protein
MPPYTGAVPVPTPETKPFWEGTKRRELRLQRCRDCQQFYFYPRPLCRYCLSRNVEWRTVSGRGRLHTFTVNYRAGKNTPLPVPYVIAMIELDEGPRLLSNLVGVDPDPAKLRCEMPVEVVFEDITEEITLPRFRPTER